MRRMASWGVTWSIVCLLASSATAHDPVNARGSRVEPPRADAAAIDRETDEVQGAVTGAPLLEGGGALRIPLRSIATGDPRRAEQPLRGHVQGETEQHQGELLPSMPTGDDPGRVVGPPPQSATPGSHRAARAPGDSWKNFVGTTSSGWIPPDPVIAVGPTYIVEVVNSGFEIYSKDGNRDREYTNLETFFSPLYPGLPVAWSPNSFVFDPRVTYDWSHDQFVLMALGRDDNNLRSYVFFAISATSNPTGDWYLYWTASPNTSYWIDYSGMAADSWGVYFTGNEIGWSTSGNGGLVASVRDDVFSGVWNGGWIFTGLTWNESGNPQAITIQPGVPNSIAGDSATFFVNTFTGSGSKASVWKLTGDRGSSPTLTRTSATVQSYAAPGVAAQPGAVADDIEMYSSGTLTAAYSNRKIYFSLNDAGSGQTGFYVSKVDVDSFAEDRNIKYYSGAEHYYYPAVGLVGNITNPLVGVAMSWSSNSVYPSGAFKLYEDFPNNADGDFWNVAAGAGTYNVYFQGRNRWGDYMGIGADPVCDSLWTVTEYAPSTDVWRTMISMFEGSAPITGICNLIFDDGFERNDLSNWSNF